jgi:hypothetical protein
MSAAAVSAPCRKLIAGALIGASLLAAAPSQAAPLGPVTALQVASPATGPTEVRWRGRGWGGGAIAGGLIAGALIGGALAAPRYYGGGPAYYGAAPYYGATPYYGAPAYYGPGYVEGPVYAAPAYAPPPPGDEVAYCMRRYRSYDPASGTFLGYDGLRHPCP